MEATQPHPTHRDRVRTATAAVGTAVVGLVVALMLVFTAQPATEPAALPETSCCEESASSRPAVIASPPVVVTSSDDEGPTPDSTADHPGGFATRLHTADGSPVPGDVFLLMATAGSDATARLYDQTPYTHDNGTAADSHESNLTAYATVETITGADLDPLEFTTAPGGGPSGGIAYTIAYLNVLSDGAFTGDLRVAATGRIDTHGYVDPINAVDEKTAAAHLAAADVLFTPSTPTDDHLDTYAARHVGELFRARHTGNPLTDERQLDNYHAWGTNRPDGMDIIHVRHIADIAAYLCGTGSTHACHITELLEDTTTEFTNEPVDTVQPWDRRMLLKRR